MIKIKQSLTLQILGFVLLPISLIFFGGATQKASAAEPGCYQEARGGRITAEACVGQDPSPQCLITDDNGVPRTVNCNSFEVSASNSGSTSSDNEFKVSINGEATLNGEYYCGKGSKQVRISFDIGCLGEDYAGRQYNPVLDMMFALLRFISAGVGLVVIGSIIWAGIQYSTSRGNPQSTEASIKRVTNAVIALLLYIFSFAILNFLVPGGLFVR